MLAQAAGPRFLKADRLAASGAATLQYGAEKLRLYDLCAWVYAPLARITRSIRNYSAKQANRILGRAGQPFWQIESYDHWVRNGAEFESIIHYIEFNPVKAGLVASPEEWRWSSASKNAGQEACAT